MGIENNGFETKSKIEDLGEKLKNPELNGESFENDDRYELELFNRLEDIVLKELNVQPTDNVGDDITLDSLKDTILYNDNHMSYDDWDKYISKESKNFLEGLGLIKK